MYSLVLITRPDRTRLELTTRNTVIRATDRWSVQRSSIKQRVSRLLGPFHGPVKRSRRDKRGAIRNTRVA